MVPLIFVKFSGVNKAAISHRSDYGGQSLLLGRQRMKDRLIAENICKTDTSVRPRIDEYLYDMDCVNEALANMLVHNDWTETEPLVAFYSDRVVFTSHGGLPQGITEEEFFMGSEQASKRNVDEDIFEPWNYRTHRVRSTIDCQKVRKRGFRHSPHLY